MNIQPLRELSLSENEIKVYVAGLKLGLVSVSSYAEKANLPRTTTYDLLKSLKEKGLAGYVIKGGVRYFSVVNPKELVEKLQEKERRIREILPELEELQKISIEKPKVEFYQGLEGTKTVANDVLKQPNIKIYNSFVSEKNLQFLPFYHQQYRRKRKERKLHVRMISEKKPLIQEMKRKDKEELRKTRFLDEVMKDSTTSFFIYGNKIAYLMLTEKEQIGVIIENKDIAEFQKKVFNYLWKTANQ